MSVEGLQVVPSNDDQMAFSRLLADIKAIINEARSAAYAGINAIQIDHNWKIGRRIVEEEQGGFYLAFQNVHTLCEQLSWSHYRLLISVENEEARAYYLEEARKSLWSVRERTQSKTQILSRNWTLARSAA